MSGALPRECQRLREWLPEYAEGRASGRLCARIEGHVSSCRRCAQEVSDLRAMLAALRATTPDALPGGVAAVVRRAVADRASARSAPALRWGLLAPAAGLAVLAAFALAFFGNTLAQHGGLSGPAPTAILQGRTAPEAGAPPPALPRFPRTREGVRVAEAAPRSGDELGAAAGPSAAREVVPGRRFQAKGREAGALPSGAPARDSGFALQAPRQGLGLRGGEGRPVKPRQRDGPYAPGRLGLEPLPCKAAEARQRAYAAGRAGGGGGGGPRGPMPRSEQADREQVAAQALPPVELARLSTGAPEGAGGTPAAAKAVVAAPRVAARVAVRQGKGKPSVALELSAGPAVGHVSVYADTPDGRQLLWSGDLERATAVPLSAEQIGRGPGTLPIAVEWQAGVSQYVLFTPTMSRLGQTSSESPAVRYHGESLGQVLAGLSALTGMVLLAEAPLSRPVEGELPAGRPADAVALVAGQAGLQVQADGDVARTLTYPH